MRGTDESAGRLRKYVTESEVRRLLAMTNETESPLRNRGLILIAYRHGLRVSELVGLVWDQDVDLEQGRLLVRRLKRGRSGIHKLLPDEIDLLTKLRAQSDSPYVFAGRHGRLSRSAVNVMLKDVGERAGLPTVTPHALRHGCGYELAMKGIDTRRLQIFLGHRSIQSTTIYTDLAEHATDSVWAA